MVLFASRSAPAARRAVTTSVSPFFTAVISAFKRLSIFMLVRFLYGLVRIEVRPGSKESRDNLRVAVLYSRHQRLQAIVDLHVGQVPLWSCSHRGPPRQQGEP